MNLIAKEPKSPWGLELLSRLYEEHGYNKKAAAMRRQRNMLTGIST